MSKVLMKGNEAIAEGAISAGCKCFFGYPITPQNQIPEYMSVRMPQTGGAFVQAESEVAAINMVYGAAGAGVRAMTSSSSPGISLKAEGISYIAAACLPAVIVNIMRGGPGLGSIQPSQSDYFQATKGGGHGDYRLITYAPASVQEAYDLVQLAFEVSDYYRCPSMILGDGMIGQMMEPVELHKAEPTRKLMPKDWATTGYKKGKERSVINTLFIEAPDLERENKKRIATYEMIKAQEVLFEEYKTENAQIIVCAYGISSRIVKSAIDILEKEGINAGLIRPITLWPFPSDIINAYAKKDRVKAFLTVEMSAGQLVEDVKLAINGQKPDELFYEVGSIIPKVSDVKKKIEQMSKAY